MGISDQVTPSRLWSGLQSDSVLPFKAKDAIQGMGWSGCQMN